MPHAPAVARARASLVERAASPIKFAAPTRVCAANRQRSRNRLPTSRDRAATRATVGAVMSSFDPPPPLEPLDAFDEDRMRWWHGEPESSTVNAAGALEVTAKPGPARAPASRHAFGRVFRAPARRRRGDEPDRSWSQAVATDRPRQTDRPWDDGWWVTARGLRPPRLGRGEAHGSRRCRGYDVERPAGRGGAVATTWRGPRVAAAAARTWRGSRVAAVPWLRRGEARGSRRCRAYDMERPAGCGRRG